MGESKRSKIKAAPQIEELLAASGSSSKKTKRERESSRKRKRDATTSSQMQSSPQTETSVEAEGELSGVSFRELSSSQPKRKKQRSGDPHPNRSERIDLNEVIATESTPHEVINTDSIPYLGSVQDEDIIEFCENLSKRDPKGTKFIRSEIMAPTVRDMLQFQRQQDFGDESDEDWLDPNIVTTEELIQWLKQAFLEEEERYSDTLEPLPRFIDNIIGPKVKVDIHVPKVFLKEYGRLNELYKLIPEASLTEVASDTIVKTLKKNIKLVGGHSFRKDAKEKFIADIGQGQSAPKDFGAFCRKVRELNNDYSQAVRKVKRMETKLDSKETSKSNKSKTTKTSSSSSSSSTKATTDTKEACWICGNLHKGDCTRKTCAWANHEKKPWKDSTQGKKYAAMGWSTCPYVENPDGPPRSKTSKLSCPKCLYINAIDMNNDMLDVFVCPKADVNVQQVKENLRAKALLDTGATGNNFINQELADMLVARYNIPLHECNIKICSALDNACCSSKQYMIITIRLTDEYNNTLDIELQCLIIDSTFDIIIGRETIKKYRLVDHFPSHFMERELAGKMLATAAGHAEKTQLLSEHISERATCYNNMETLRRQAKEHLSYNNNLLTSNSLVSTMYSPPISSMRISAYEKEDIGEIRDNYLESIPEEIVTNTQEKVEGTTLPTKISGPESLQRRVREIHEIYKDRFKTTVSDMPMDVPPFELEVDRDAWEQPKHCGPPRKMDRVRQYACKKQIDTFVEHGIIQPSTAPYYSQVLLVPKPNDKWRFCVDYKGLNKHTQRERWPIPNIKEMLERIGSKKPKYFIILDLVSGYYQAKISEYSRKWTAFITFWGVFEWLRLPMGLSGAPSYFQRVLTTIVLAGLIMFICELYLDDLIIYASTEDELIENYVKVLERFRKYNVYINPEKVKIGESEVQYVGHTLNEEGLHFTRERLDSVLNFPKPETMKGLKSFLGLANYFRDHVHNHSLVVRPLNKMLLNYHRRKRLQWTEDANEAFEKIKLMIHECPTLFFIDDESPIYLLTDASDYGIGAYLYQVVDGVERPIGFLSKTFDERMMNWDTPQKEGYAIYYALDKWDYLLRYRYFTIKTDHKNITQLRTDYAKDKKVQRWLKCFQAYDYDLCDIKGSDNVVADAFSRLCALESKMETKCASLIPDIKVPNKEWEIIKRFHNNVTGHHGIDRTIQKLRDNGHKWSKQGAHVTKFIKTCPCCQKMSRIKPIINAHPFTVSTYGPMQRIAVDFIQSLHPDEDGYTNILVIIDSFSRWVELIPTKNLTAMAAAKGLLQHLGRYGAPIEIHSDLGPAFVDDLTKSLIEMVGSNQSFSMAYSKEENAIVERANKEILRHLRNIIFDKNVLNNWSMYLPLVQRIMNSSKHRSTGVTPASILFGNAVDLDKSLFIEHNEYLDGNEQKLSHWIDRIQKVQSTIMDIARRNLRKHDEIHMATAPNIQTKEFPINSYVLVEHRQNALRPGPASKLLPYLKGPMRVVNVIGDKYTLQDIVTKRNKDYHIKKLREFNYDPSTIDPLQVACKDGGNFYAIDHISKIKGRAKGPKSQIKFLVHWIGYEKPTWEPWANVRKTYALQNFLTQHPDENVRNLLPRNVVYSSDEED